MNKKRTIIATFIFSMSMILAGIFMGCQSLQTEITDIIKESNLPETTIGGSQELYEELDENSAPTKTPILDESQEDDAEAEFISQRIKNYTNEYFRFAENVEVDFEDENATVSVSFIPEVGSFIIKEDVYENVATHAYRIIKFFPEVKCFYYIILADNATKGEALYLTIDESAIENIEETYWNQYLRRNGGSETNFSEVFSEIEETEESKTWRVRIDPNAELP